MAKHVAGECCLQKAASCGRFDLCATAAARPDDTQPRAVLHGADKFTWPCLCVAAASRAITAIDGTIFIRYLPERRKTCLSSPTE